jgi:mono/diheme cytochrome c family protein
VPTICDLAQRRWDVRLSKTLAVVAFVLTSGAAVLIAGQTPAGAPAAASPNREPPAAAPAQAPTQAPAQAPGGRGGRGAPAGGGGFANAYPQHAQADQAAIDRGKALFGVNCSFCHGSDARGGEGGPNLLRSQLVMNDQNGELMAPVVQNGRPGTAMPKFDLTTAQVSDIAAFVHSFRVAGYDASRDIPPNILVGNAQAGEAFFNGPGKCSTCHSVTGDLAGIGAKMEPKLLQNAIVSGRAGRGGFGAASASPATQVTATVTLASGKVVEGKLDHLDDFLVSVTDADGNHLSFARNGDVPKVVVHNPLQAHLDMLPKLTDDEIHNLTAYLVTLK